MLCQKKTLRPSVAYYNVILVFYRIGMVPVEYVDELYNVVFENF